MKWYLPKSIQRVQIKFCCASFCCLHTWTNTENLEWFRAWRFSFTIQVRLDILYMLLLPTCWSKLSDHWMMWNFFNVCLEWCFQEKTVWFISHTSGKMNWNYQWPEKKQLQYFFSFVKAVLHMYTETVSYFVAPYHVTVQPVFKHLVQKCRLDVASILKGESLAFLCLRNKYILLDVNCLR